MSITLVPLDFTALTTAQQNNAFKVWCGGVMLAIAELNHKALLVFEDLGNVGMATEKVIQKADVWIDDLKVNVMIAFNDMLETDVPNQSRPDEKRNFPGVKAKALVEAAQDHAQEQASGTLGAYEVTPRPASGDIEV